MHNTPLIDREIFFGNPQISGAQLSPNGAFITFIKPYKNVMNIWIKAIDDPFEDAYPITQDTSRPIRSYFWSRDSKYVLYVQDKGGDENFRLYRVDPKEATKDFIPTSKDLTPFDDIRAFILSLPKKQEDKIFVGINDRDKAWHDYYSLDIASGERTLLYENNERLDSLTFDLDSNIRLASRSLPDGSDEILQLTDDGFQTILSSNLEETLSPLRFHNDGRVYFISNVGEPDLMGLYLYDLESKKMELVESDPLNLVDIENASFSPTTDELISTVYIADKKRIYWKSKSYENDYNFLESQFEGAEISITSTTKDESKWLFYVNSDIDPGSAYYFDRASKEIKFLYTPRPELPKEHLVKMHGVTYDSLDGLEIPAYLTLPNTKEQKNLPAVLYVHGGPWARDYWGYNSFAQFLANRGYVVLQPNFRGSTGYGKKFLNAAINEWGQKMQDDLTAGAHFLIEQGYADPKKIIIMGGSYGGYATLAGLTFTPDTYAGGVSIVGPSNLFTLLETIPPYWESARAMFHKRMGDPNTEEGREQLTRQSPFFHAKNIKVPLLVAQGGNDPRVKKSESDQIVIAMRDLNLPVEYINFEDEGHGFANPDNNMAFITVMEKFLAQHIGGRYQEEAPDKIKSIIEKATVDISALKMPEIISDEKKNQVLPFINQIIDDTTYNYALSLEIQGQHMQFDVKRSIENHNTHLLIKDESSSPMGNMNDVGHVAYRTFHPMFRNVEQGPLTISLNFTDDDQIKGEVNMQGQVQQVSITLKNTYLMDGPSLDIYLSHLPLKEDYTTILRIFDTQNQKLQTYTFEVVGSDTVELYDCYKCELKSIDGPDKSQTHWIYKSGHPILVKKESVIAEMGGAIMRMMIAQRNRIP
ncbi:MAG: S9 family peptidase [Saprospiraceae bacterium]|nr:S9 family peptidase [Saprospiraceae bacterium]